MGENGGKGPVIGISSATYKQSEYPGSSYESVGLVASEGCMYQDKRVHGGKEQKYHFLYLNNHSLEIVFICCC